MDGSSGYGWRAFRADLFAGLTVAAVAVPQGMAYALIAGVDARYGLYTAIVMTALGSLFGSSSHLINGPTNAISLVVFGAVATLGVESDAGYLRAVFLLAMLVGVIQIVIALLRLGDLTRYVSESVILGFMLGAAVLVALSQLPPLFGLPQRGDGHDHFLRRLWQSLSQIDVADPAPVNWLGVTAGVATLLLVIALRKIKKALKVELPDHLIALLTVSVAVWVLGWKMGEIDPIPRQLPAPRLPEVRDLGWVPRMTGSAFSIALLGLLEALAIAKSISARTRQPLDYNRQCLAEGLANLGGGLFQCMPGSGSLTRSAINYQAGALTRLSGVYSAAAVAATLLLLAPLAQYIPKPAIAGMLIITAWRLVDKRRLAYCLRAGRFDAGLAWATAFVTVFFSIELSILIGTFLSFLLVIPRMARLRHTELVVTAERVVRERRPGDEPCDRLGLVSLEGEIFFGAGPELEHVFDQLRARAGQGMRVIVLRLKRTRNPDMVCLELLQRFLEDMQKPGVPVLLCGVREDFAQALDRLGFRGWLPPERLFLEDEANDDGLSSTLRAVKRAYELLGEDLCASCPRRQELSPDKGWYYMI